MKRKLLPVAIIGAAVVISIAMNLLKPAPLKAESPDTAVAVKTKILYKTQAQLSVESQGTVVPRTRTLLTSEVSGRVLSLSPNFVVGGMFQAGDILLELDPTDYQVALKRADANLISMNAQLTFERARATQAQKEWAMTGRPADEAPLLALRKPYIEEAQARVLQAEAEVQQAKIKLRRTKIRAPYAGVVAAKSVDLGQYVSVGTHMGEIFAIDFAEVRLPLTKRDLSMLTSFSLADGAKHLQISLFSSADSESKRWDAKLVRSEGVIDQGNRSLYVVAQVDDPYGSNREDNANVQPLLMGTFVKAVIDGKPITDVFAIPRHALLEGNKIALVNDDLRLRLQSVEPIYSDKQYYYLSHAAGAGVTEGAEIIVSNIGVPIEGMNVAPESVEPVSAASEIAVEGAQGANFDVE